MATPNLRTELPPGFSGQVKPTFDLADRTGEQRFAETVGDMAAKHWANIIQARQANEVAAFRGVMRTQQALLEKELRARPGMPIEKYDELKNTMIANIKKAAGTATTRGGRERNRDLYDKDAESISVRADAIRNSIVSSQELNVFNLNREKWIATGDLAGLKEGWEGMSGNLYAPEQVELMLRNDTAVLLEGTILRQALAMPEAEGAAWIAGANKVATEQYKIEGELFSPDDLARIKKRYTSAVNTINAENKVAMEAARDIALDEYTEAIAGGDFSNELTRKIALDPRLDAYSTERRVMINWQEQRRTAINKDEPNPLTERQNDELFWTDYKLAEDGEISETELRSHVGKDGYTIDDYQEIKRVLGTDVSGKSRAKEISTAISDLDSVIDAGTDEYEAQERQAAKMRGRRQLEGAIAEADKAEKPLKGIDLDREALRIGRKLLDQIDREFTPEQIFPVPREVGKPGTVVRTGGEVIGTVDTDGKLVLNENGLRRVLRITGGDVVRAREFMAERGFKEPD